MCLIALQFIICLPQIDYEPHKGREFVLFKIHKT